MSLLPSGLRGCASALLLVCTVARVAAVDVGANVTTVLLTGATGRTGKETYAALKSAGSFSVRALVRNASKAREVLGCRLCDESEGIFVGDVTKPGTMASAMKGADALVIATGPVVKCRLGPLGCKYLPGGSPKEVVWEGLQKQVAAFGSSPGRPARERHVILLSTGLTTKPDNFLDKLGNGKVCFYSLNGEAFLMSSGLPFTIVKACGLGDGAAGKSRLVVGHDDSLSSASTVRRSDVARVLAAAAAAPSMASGLRFDLCAAWFGKPTEDASTLFPEAMYPWDPRKSTTMEEIAV